MCRKILKKSFKYSIKIIKREEKFKKSPECKK